MSVAGYIVLTLEFRKTGNRWTAYCEELGTATFGRSLPEADKKIREAVNLHLDTLEDVGERDRFFRENNIAVYRTKPEEDVTVRLPVRESVFVQTYVQPVYEPVLA